MPKQIKGREGVNTLRSFFNGDAYGNYNLIEYFFIIML